jgi:hypothetical protein
MALLLVGVTALALATPTAQAATPYKPPQLTNQAVQDATLKVSLEYANAVPGLDAKTLRWFLYAVEHRESTFSTTHCNYNDGAGNWNRAIPSSSWPTSDHIPHGCGLTQLTGWTHAGMPYPGNSGSAPTMLGKGIYGSIAPPRPVTSLSNPFDPLQNLRRFVTEEVLPDFVLIKRHYPSYNTEQVLRAVAFHWNKGEYTSYQPWNCDYLCLYDQYVRTYKPAVLADAAWPPGGTPTSPPSGPVSATFTVSPNINSWWIEVGVSPHANAVRASVNGGAPIALKATSWGAWAVSAYVPHGAHVVFTATVIGATAVSPMKTWP